MNAPLQLSEDEKESVDLAALVVRAQGGDREAFGELFSRYERLVLAIGVRGLGDYAEAQDLAQDVFLQALSKLHQLKNPAVFGSWLRSIASRMTLNKRSRNGYRWKETPVADPEDLQAHYAFPASLVDEETPVDVLLREELHDDVWISRQLLKPSDRRILELFYDEDLSLKETQRTLSAEDGAEYPMGTIKRRLHVARKRLEEVLDPAV